MKLFSISNSLTLTVALFTLGVADMPASAENLIGQLDDDTLQALAIARDSSENIPSSPSTNVPYISSIGQIDWSGLYVGAGASFGDGKFSSSFLENITTDLSGITYGVFGGFNIRYGSGIIVGLEAELSNSTLEGLIEAASGGNTLPKSAPDVQNPTDTRVKHGYEISGRIRIGFSFQKLLLYAGGGLVGGQMTLSSSPGNSQEDKTLGYGVNLGAGVDYAMNSSLLLRVEYRQTSYGNHIIDFRDSLNTISQKRNEFRASIGYRL